MSIFSRASRRPGTRSRRPATSANYSAYIGGNSSLYDWRDAGPLRPDWAGREGLSHGDGLQQGRSHCGLEKRPSGPRVSRLTPAIREQQTSPPVFTGRPAQRRQSARQAGEVLILPYFEGSPTATGRARVSGQLETPRPGITRVDTEGVDPQIPGGMISNMESQLRQRGCSSPHQGGAGGGAQCSPRDAGYPPLVTPSSRGSAGDAGRLRPTRGSLRGKEWPARCAQTSAECRRHCRCPDSGNRYVTKICSTQSQRVPLRLGGRR